MQPERFKHPLFHTPHTTHDSICIVTRGTYYTWHHDQSIINNTMSFSSPSSFSSSVYFSSPPSSSPSTPPPASSYPSPTNKPKVLFIGDLGGHETFDKQIRQIAEVHTLPKVTYDETVELIKQKVEQVGGGFVAFGVSHLNIIYPVQRERKEKKIKVNRRSEI